MTFSDFLQKVNKKKKTKKKKTKKNKKKKKKTTKTKKKNNNKKQNKKLTLNEVTPYFCPDFGFVYTGQVIYRNL